MQRPAQGAQPAAIELGPVDRPEPAGRATGPATSVAEAEVQVPLRRPPARPEPTPEPMYEPDPMYAGTGDHPESYRQPPFDDTMTGHPPPLLPPPPWLARELDRPEPVTPAVPFFDREATGPAEPQQPQRGPRRYPLILAGFLALFLLAALVGAGVVDAMRGDTGGATGAQPGDATGGQPGDADPQLGGGTAGDTAVEPELATERTVTGPLGDLQEAQFDLISGTTTVNIRTADLGEELYRVSTPIDADVQPRVIADGEDIQLHLVPSGQPGPGVVDIALHSAVRWQLRLTGGVAQHSIDLSGADLAGVDIVGGAARIDLTVPAPDGTMPIRMTGGANQFVITAPDGAPAQVRFGAGAAGASIDGRNRDGIAPGAVFTGDGWAAATDRYDIDVVAGVSVFTLQRN